MIGEWKTREPVDESKEKRSYFFALAISGFFVVTCLGLIYKSGILTSEDVGLLRQEVDLSGRWKVKLEDRDEFAAANWDDSRWCEIGVPNGDLLKKGEQSGDCKDFWYDRDQFRNKTFWYRKTFELKDVNAISEPSLFLGAIKERAWVYLNGSLVGMTRVEDMPSILSIERKILQSGKNSLSVRVYSGNARYPGMFHAFNRGIVLGEYSKNILPRKQLLREQYLEPLITVVIQLFCLFVSMFLLYYGFGASEKYRWLSIYFGSSAFYAVAPLIYTTGFGAGLRYFLDLEGIFGILLGTAGFSIFLASEFRAKKSALTWALIASLVVISVLNILGVYFGVPGDLIRGQINKLIFITLFCIISYQGYFAFNSGRLNLTLGSSSLVIFLAMLVLCVFLFIETIVYPSGTASHFSLVSSVVSVSIIFLSVREYIFSQKALSFFGRFIRPGLRNLLSDLGFTFSQDRKVFRGRKIPIVKLDISDHTSLTFRMPYGMKRLFQDLWFLMIDSEFKDLMFVDKNMGDGSIYFINEKASSQICLSTLNAVLRIRDHLLSKFWEAYHAKLLEVFQKEPELAKAGEKFIEDYQKRTGNDFWKNEIKIHAALVFGYVDEGLWGLLSQSHYDVQGDLVTLAARMEAEAKTNEILIDEAFLKELEKEDKLYSKKNFEWRLVDLKGIGKFKVGSLKVEKRKAA
jgi:class 3 adenylate cyclase